MKNYRMDMQEQTPAKHNKIEFIVFTSERQRHKATYTDISVDGNQGWGSY